jgi:radical SAM superfamily enzyme YgiQ (UPF0313 family)
MNVLLIQPQYKDTWASPPLSIGYLAAVLEEHGHKVDFIDLTLTPLSEVDFKRFIMQTNPGLIGISVMVRALSATKTLISYIRQVKNVPVVIGGAQPTVEPVFSLKYTRAEFAVVGEGERTIVELIEALESRRSYEQVDGLVFLSNNGDYKINQPREFIKNLEQIPFPDWNLISPLKYKIQPALTPVKMTPIAPIITTRGCPYRCNFCGGPLMWRRTFRMRNAKNIVDEIEILIKGYKVKEIFISDDNFTLVKDHVIGMCNELLDRKINIPWACPNGIRIDTVDDGILRLMKKAGCHLVGFGIESGNQEILDNARKQLDLKRVKEVVRMAKLNKLITYGFFIIGLPGETTETIRQTIDFAKQLPLDRAWFNILVPYPGTEIFDMYAKGKSLDEIDWDNFDASTGMISSGIRYRDLQGPDLVYWQRRALREFYLSNPKVFMSVISHMNLGSIKTLVKTSFFKRLLKGAKN